MEGLEFHTTVDEALEEASQFRPQAGRRRCCQNAPVLALFSSAVVAFLLIVVWISRASNSLTATSDDVVLLLGDSSSSSRRNSSSTTNITSSTQNPSCASSSSSMICSQTGHEDRLGHNILLHAGQAICNDEYQFGITLEGALVWQHCSSSPPPLVVLHQDPAAIWFQMTENATFQLLDDSNQVLWEATSKQKVHFTPKCLSAPQLDCPYLHLHKSGDVVLNYIDDDGSWNDRKVRRSFPDLF